MAFHTHNYYKIWLLDLSLGRWTSTRQMEIIASNQMEMAIGAEDHDLFRACVMISYMSQSDSTLVLVS